MSHYKVINKLIVNFSDGMSFNYWRMKDFKNTLFTVAQFYFSSSLDLVQEEMAWMVYQKGLDLRFDYFLFKFFCNIVMANHSLRMYCCNYFQ